MKKKTIIIFLLLMISAAAIFGFIKFRAKKLTPPVNTVWVKAKAAEEVSLPLEVIAIGTLTARSVEITPAVAGHVENILFKDGTFVKQGTPLLQLDDAIYKAKRQSAKAQLVYSENDFKRKALLGKQGAIAQQAIDQAEADFKAKNADAKEAEVMINKMQLAAPFDGVVGKSKVNRGDYVTVAQSVVTLTDNKHLRVEYSVPEKYLPLLKQGQVVKVTVAAYPSKVFYGKLSFISPTVNTENRSIALYADVPNNDNLLAPGMFVNVTQSLGMENHVLIIPARSLVPILDGEQVFKIVEGKAYAVNVMIGKRTEQNVQVTQGLSPGDVVITDGQLKVKNGMDVKVES